MDRTDEDRAAAKAQAVGVVIHNAIAGYRVKRWLDGSEAKADRPTLAEVEACGYKVVPA